MIRKPDPASGAVTGLLVLMVAVGPISTDLYLPALPGIQTYFNSDTATVQLTLSVYLAAFALSQMIFGPLSDRFGRRRIAIAGLGLYTAASVLCTVADSMEILIAARFLQAVGACSGQVVARAIVRDVHGAAEAGRVLSKIVAAMGIAPLIGPILGGYLTDAFGWQACFIALSLAGGLALAGGILLLQETNRHCDPDATAPTRIVSNIILLLRDRHFRGHALAASGSYAGLFAFISGSSFVFIDYFGISVTEFGYCFSLAILGFVIGARIAARMQGGPRAIGWGAVINLVFGCAMLAPLLFGFASIATLLVPMILYMVGMGIVLPHGQAGAVGPYPHMAGTASALVGTMQYTIASVVGIAVGQGFLLAGTASPLPMALAIAASGLFTFACHQLLIRPCATSD